MSKNYKSDTLLGLNRAWYTKNCSDRNTAFPFSALPLNNFYPSPCI